MSVSDDGGALAARQAAHVATGALLAAADPREALQRVIVVRDSTKQLREEF